MHRWNPDLGLILQRAHQIDHLRAFVTLLDALSEPRDGALRGLPFAVKDMIDTAGVQTSYGSAIFRDHVPSETATCVEALVEAGGVLVGKTSTHEFAYGTLGDSFDGGPARNPHDPDRIAGGSSAGSAIAVAAGVVPIALGTDTGGSARIPAALCGAVGFKPTYGAISTRGVFPLARSLDTVGILGSEPSDVRAVARVLLTDSGQGDRKLTRLGVISPSSLPPVQPEVSDLVGSVARELGAETVTFPPLDLFWDPYRWVQGPEAYKVHRSRLNEEPDRIQPDVRERLRAAGLIAGWQYLEGMEFLQKSRAGCAAVFADVDALLLPTVPITAPLIGERDVEIDGAVIPTRDALLSLTSAFNVLGWPALSLPCGFIDGLPVGLQLVGPKGSDLSLIDLAEQLTERLIATKKEEA